MPSELWQIFTEVSHVEVYVKIPYAYKHLLASNYST